MDTDKDETIKFTEAQSEKLRLAYEKMAKEMLNAHAETQSRLDRIEGAILAVKEREEKRLDVFRQVVLYALGLLGVKK